MTEVLPGIHQFRLPMADNKLRYINGYLLESDDGYVLVDCGWGTDDVYEALEGEMRAIGADLGDIRRLIVTHFHSDHYGLAGRLVQLGKLRLLMHHLDWLHIKTNHADEGAVESEVVDWMGRHGWTSNELDDEAKRAMDSFRLYTVVAPHEELDDEVEIGVGRHMLKVVWTPGHTQGHICLYDAERRLLLSGDHVLDPITPHVGVVRARSGNPLGEFLASLHKVAALEADLVLPAHGEPFEGLQRRVNELLEHHYHREGLALEALEHGPVTALEVAQHVPWTRRQSHLDELPRMHQRMALSETIAHLEELRVTGRITSTEHDGRIYYEARATGEHVPDKLG